MSENTQSDSSNIITLIAKIYDEDPSQAMDFIFLLAQISQINDLQKRLKGLQSLEHLIKAIQV